ncbi:hypothetical protein ES703_96250 [subsurface metagenome]
MFCSSCGVNTVQDHVMRREYEKLGFHFCQPCVVSNRAYIWAEEEIEIRGIRKMETRAKKLQMEKGKMHNTWGGT